MIMPYDYEKKITNSFLIYEWSINNDNKKIWVPLVQIYIAPSYVEIGLVILEEKIFKCEYIFALPFFSPIVKGCSPLFEQTWIPFTFVPSLVEIGQVILEKKKEIFKVYDNANAYYDNNDDGKRTYCDQKSSLWLRWAKKNTWIGRTEEYLSSMIVWQILDFFLNTYCLNVCIVIQHM